ncbi:MAG: SurA N-terminal domain-containing protein [Candidatus Cloacimonetes bacterium]|nr:SurA N-terminal domain-containing protein [Candidatus Cloacimonadota bacterium]
MPKRWTLTAVLLCIAMLAAATEPDSSNVVLKVGSRSYSYKSYNDGFHAFISYYGRGRTITAQDSIRLNDQYWGELIGLYIYDQAIKAGKVKVSDAEVERNIMENPPDGVKNIKDFQTKGVFDAAKYLQALQDRPDFKKSVIDLSRDLFTYEKLINTIKSEARINADSLQAGLERDSLSTIDTLTAKAQTEYFNDWFLQQRSKLEIIDNRERFYPLLKQDTPSSPLDR